MKPTQHPPPVDPRLAAIAAADGSIDPVVAVALLDRDDPSTMTTEQLKVVEAIIAAAPADIAVTQEWLEAFYRAIGCTITREKRRNGEVVERTVEYHRGRADVRAYRRAQQVPPTASPTLARPQARRRGAGRPRATASRSSARSGDSGDDGEGPEAEAARLRGFLLYLTGFDWPEALIDRAYRFSVDIEREVTS